MPAAKLLPISKVAEEFTGKRAAPATVWRWLRKGCRGVKLSDLMLGGRWLCSEDDFREFLLAQTEAQLAATSGGPASDDELVQAGLL